MYYTELKKNLRITNRGQEVREGRKIKASTIFIVNEGDKLLKVK